MTSGIDEAIARNRAKHAPRTATLDEMDARTVAAFLGFMADDSDSAASTAEAEGNQFYADDLRESAGDLRRIAESLKTQLMPKSDEQE